jgi:hypothetical protein
MDFKIKKRSHSNKKKLMLWIDQDLIDRLEGIKPDEITVQEAIRQLTEEYVTDFEALGGV